MEFKMSAKRILIIDDLHESIIQMLEEVGYLVDDEPDLKANQVENIIHEYTGLVLRSKLTVDEKLLSKAKHLKFIARAGAGLDQLDMDVIDKRGIKVFNAPEGNRDALGEHMTGMLLSLLHKITIGNSQVKNGQWLREENRGNELSTKTVGIIGYGHMGSAFAQKLSSFGCTILAYDKYKSGFGDDTVKEADMTELFDRCDVLSLHIPYLPENHHLVDGAFLHQFAKPIYLLNSSRGKIVDQKAMIAALESGRIVGAALDVLANEKLDTYTPGERAQLDKLAGMPHVLLTPHVAGWSFESYEKISRILGSKILSLDL